MPGCHRPQYRLSVRWLMVAVAIAAVLFGGVIELPRLWNLRQQYLGFAEKYAYWEVRYNGAVHIRQEITYYSIRLPRGPEPSPRRLSTMKAMASHYAGFGRSTSMPPATPGFP